MEQQQLIHHTTTNKNNARLSTYYPSNIRATNTTQLVKMTSTSSKTTTAKRIGSTKAEISSRNIINTGRTRRRLNVNYNESILSKCSILSGETLERVTSKIVKKKRSSNNTLEKRQQQQQRSTRK